MLKRIFWGMNIFWVCINSYALDYAQAYQQALLHDSKWLSAEQEAQASLQDQNISRANLLPNVSFNYRWSDNDSEGEVTRQGAFAKQNRQYNSYFSALVLRQPLFNLATIHQYSQAKLTAKVASLRLHHAKQQLAVRVLESYLAVLMSKEELRLSEVYLDILSHELQRSQRLFQYGEATKTDQLEIQSRYQFAQVELINIRDQYDADQRILETLIGQNIENNRVEELLTSSFTSFKQDAFADHAELSQWQQLMQNHNAEFVVAQLMYEVAQLQVKRLQAEYYPVVNAFAQKQITTSNTENSVGEKYNTGSFGIEVSFPLFSGGSTSASVRQAKVRVEQARYDMRTVQQQSMNTLRREYLNLTGAQQRIQAYEQAVKNAEVQITATKYSMQGGERTNLDVLNAQQQFHRAKKDLIKTNYDFLKAWLAIRLQAGVLNEDDINLLSTCFKSPKH